MTKIRKIINDPEQIVDEVIDGLVLASHGAIKQVEGAHAIIRSHVPDGKVALLIGGGSGHEPMYSAYIGEGLADATVLRQHLRGASARHHLRGDQGGPSRQGRPLRLRQLCR